jgi:hypothetical protein
MASSTTSTKFRLLKNCTPVLEATNDAHAKRRAGGAAAGASGGGGGGGRGGAHEDMSSLGLTGTTIHRPVTDAEALRRHYANAHYDEHAQYERRHYGDGGVGAGGGGGGYEGSSFHTMGDRFAALKAREVSMAVGGARLAKLREDEARAKANAAGGGGNSRINGGGGGTKATRPSTAGPRRGGSEQQYAHQRRPGSAGHLAHRRAMGLHPVAQAAAVGVPGSRPRWGLYELNSVYPHSLKAPGFNP